MNNKLSETIRAHDIKELTISKEHAEEIQRQLEEFNGIRLMYRSALREINTKLEILNDEFQNLHEHNPIEHIKSRVKTPKSIAEKLIRKGLPVNLDTAIEALNDIAGVRVICSFIDDIYLIADMLTLQDDVKLISKKDYIKEPKPNGYRSLHLVVEIPVFFSNSVEHLRVEIQIRTIAMDFWASLEHKLYYKYKGTAPDDITEDLRRCSQQICSIDENMMSINRRIRGNGQGKV